MPLLALPSSSFYHTQDNTILLGRCDLRGLCLQFRLGCVGGNTLAVGRACFCFLPGATHVRSSWCLSVYLFLSLPLCKHSKFYFVWLFPLIVSSAWPDLPYLRLHLRLNRCPIPRATARLHKNLKPRPPSSHCSNREGSAAATTLQNCSNNSFSVLTTHRHQSLSKQLSILAKSLLPETFCRTPRANGGRQQQLLEAATGSHMITPLTSEYNSSCWCCCCCCSRDAQRCSLSSLRTKQIANTAQVHGFGVAAAAAASVAAVVGHSVMISSASSEP